MQKTSRQPWIVFVAAGITNVFSWHTLLSHLNRAVARAMDFPAHPGGNCPYDAARCRIGTIAARGSTTVFAEKCNVLLKHLSRLGTFAGLSVALSAFFCGEFHFPFQA